jgi:hypothetical protein
MLAEQFQAPRYCEGEERERLLTTISNNMYAKKELELHKQALQNIRGGG